MKALIALLLISTAHAEEKITMDDLYTEIAVRDAKIETLQRVVEILQGRVDNLYNQCSRPSSFIKQVKATK